MGDDEENCSGERPANDNHPPEERAAGGETDASERLDAVVLSVARLIGRRMAREDYEAAIRAANDNNDPDSETAAQGDHQGADDD